MPGLLFAFGLAVWVHPAPAQVVSAFDLGPVGAWASLSVPSLDRPWSCLPTRTAAALDLPSSWNVVTGSTFARGEDAFGYRMFAESSSSGSLVLDNFDAGTHTGSVQPSTSWFGQVTQNASSLTIGGTALNENGWGATSLNLDATGLTFLTVTAQRDAGHEGSSLFLQLEDRAASTNTHIIAIDTSLFAIGVPTTVQVPIGTWSSEFMVDAIGSWSVGGGGVGTSDFRMTLYDMELTATAIPEPAAVAAVLGLTAFGIALHRRRSGAESPRP